MKDREFVRDVIKKIYENNINLKNNEKILIFTDDSKRCEDIQKESNLLEIAIFFAEVAKNYTKNVKFLYYPSLCGHGKEPPEEIWITAFGEEVIDELKRKGYFEKILAKKVNDYEINEISEIVRDLSNNIPPDVVIALPYYSTSHTLFRKLLTDICGTRYCSMPLFEEEMFYSGLQEDFHIIKKRAEILKEKLSDGETVIVKAKNGTYIRFSIKGRAFNYDIGDLTYPGAFSNLPAGEVFIAPCEGTADGKIVIEYAPTFKLSSALTLWLSDGEVVHIEGKDKYLNELNTKFSLDKNNNKLAEFGIGINSQAVNFFNILEAEKIYGTVHFAFGDNSTFGGKIKANFHEDYIVQYPTVEVFKSNGKSTLILKEGIPYF